MAHILAASGGGPRPPEPHSAPNVAAIANLILLCPDCHTTVDKAPDEFPIGTLRRWKTEHEDGLRTFLGVVRRASRSEARSDLVASLVQTRTIWQAYGPDAPGVTDPENETAKSWRRKVLESVLPLNRRVLMILDVNRTLLRDDETVTVELFRQHVDDLQARHVHGIAEAAALRFPIALNDVFK